MLDIFNQYLDGFNYFITALFTRMKFLDDVSIGWMLLAISIMAIVTRFLYGRIKS